MKNWLFSLPLWLHTLILAVIVVSAIGACVGLVALGSMFLRGWGIVPAFAVILWAILYGVAKEAGH